MTTTLEAMFASNPSAESKGKWIWFGGEESDPDAFGFLIARAGGANSKYERKLFEESRPVQKLVQIERNKPSETTLKKLREITKKVFIETCLLDWKNIKTSSHPDGIPFSKQAAADLFEQFPELYDELVSQAQSSTTFRETDVEDEAKN